MVKHNLIVDCDGILTNPNVYIDKNGNYVMKAFSVNDSLFFRKLVPALKQYCDLDLNVVCLTGAGGESFSITKARLDYYGVKVELVPNLLKYKHIKNKFGFDNTTYIGDDMFDVATFKEVCWSGTVSSAPFTLRNLATYVSAMNGGEGAFIDIVFNWLSSYFNIDINRLLTKMSYDAVIDN